MNGLLLEILKSKANGIEPHYKESEKSEKTISIGRNKIVGETQHLLCRSGPPGNNFDST